MFRWMGEVNLVKQALFRNGHEPVPLALHELRRVPRERRLPRSTISLTITAVESGRTTPLGHRQVSRSRRPDRGFQLRAGAWKVVAPSGVLPVS